MLNKRLRTTLNLCLLLVLALGATSCSSTEDPPLRLGSSLKELQSHYVSDGIIEYEYLNDEDESHLTGVVIPSHELVDRRPNGGFSGMPNIQCQVEDGEITLCKKFLIGGIKTLDTVYGQPIKGLRLEAIGKEAFVKVRLPRIDFYSNFRGIDAISKLSENEQRTFSGRVMFSNEHEVFSYDFVDGEAISVEVSTSKPRTWP